MAVQAVVPSAPFGAETLYHVVRFIEAVLEPVSEHFARARARRQLERLDHHALVDIGLAQPGFKHQMLETPRIATFIYG